MFIVAVGALHPHEPVFQAAIIEVICIFLLYMHRQGLALRGHYIPELRVVPINDLVKKCLYRSVSLVWWAKW